MKTRLWLVAFALLAVLLLTGCQASADESQAAADGLDGSSWKLVFIRKSTPIEGSAVTVTFSDGEISGRLGCNGYGGAYSVQGNKLSIDTLALTEMWCEEPEGIMSQETLLAEYLLDVESYRLEGDRLYLRTSAGEELTYDRAVE